MEAFLDKKLVGIQIACHLNKEESGIFITFLCPWDIIKPSPTLYQVFPPSRLDIFRNFTGKENNWKWSYISFSNQQYQQAAEEGRGKNPIKIVAVNVYHFCTHVQKGRGFDRAASSTCPVWPSLSNINPERARIENKTLLIKNMTLIHRNKLFGKGLSWNSLAPLWKS